MPSTNNNYSTVTPVPGPEMLFVIYITGEVVISTITAAGNGLVIAAIIKHPRLQTVTNYFVASLATADFLVGVLGIPCAIVSFVGLKQNYVSCVLVNIMIIILTQISVLGLCAVAVERFIAIKYPYKYAESCTAKLCLSIIVIIWLMGIVIAVIPLLIWDKSSTYDGWCSFGAVIDLRDVVYVNFFICTLIPLGFMFAIYCYIFYVVKQQLRRIAAVQQLATDSNRNTALRKDTKAAKWFAVVIILFAISWLPLHIMNALLLYGGPFCLPCILVAVVFSHANSAINPILYAYANSKFKIAFKQMLGLKAVDDDNSVLHSAGSE
ncbi:hypothetical protein LSH36_561g00026 [Paralvinella palmiformis]|uniref:G-protein coupled receptors family 1 profile domain-containing protein n=1 Tax=Paralvinella palmiformis TaxID=53620 RepID=A0AAD9MY50_9ANNE|nr:hypothetical protein LSH36_561g00026 [Paralvinella palmiformis]